MVQVEPNPLQYPPIVPGGNDVARAVWERVVRLYDNCHYSLVVPFVEPFLDLDSSTTFEPKLKLDPDAISRDAVGKRAADADKTESSLPSALSTVALSSVAEAESDEEENSVLKRLKRDTSDGRICFVLELGPARYWEMMWRVLRCLVRARDYARASQLIVALVKMEWSVAAVFDKVCLYVLALGWPFSESDNRVALRCVRQVCARYPTERFAWNAFCRIIAGNHALLRKMNKPVMRISKRVTDPIVQIMMGHLFTVKASLPYATREYIKAAEAMHCEEPLTLLSLSVAYLGLARSRALDDRHAAVLRGLQLAFEAADHTSPASLGLYNIGRAFHHLGIFDCAVKYYEMCLQKREDERHDELLLDRVAKEARSIERDAAYNLSCIYRESGNTAAALRITRQYLSL